MEITNDSLKSFLQTWDGTGDIAESYQNHLQQASTSTSKFASTLKNVAANMGIALATTLAFKAIAYVIDQVVVTYQELKETAINAAEEFNNLKSKSESLNSELKSTGDRIEELEKKPNLTFVEQEELRKLREANEGLNRSVKLLEAKKVAGEEDCEKHCINHIRKFRNNKELMVDSNMTYRVFFCSDLL